jgi:hypothetical protein
MCALGFKICDWLVVCDNLLASIKLIKFLGFPERQVDNHMPWLTLSPNHRNRYWRTGTTNRVIVPCRWRNRFLGIGSWTP